MRHFLPPLARVNGAQHVIMEAAAKTIPVATSDQFMSVPSTKLSMGGVSIALDDPLYNPFVNPAKGISNEGVRLKSRMILYF